MTRDDLLRFCAGEEDVSVGLRAPWTVGERSIACNGHVLIRVPRLADVEERDHPKIDRIWPQMIPFAWFSVPEVPQEILDGQVELGGIPFGYRPLRLLHTLPGCEIGPISDATPALIRFDGGDGLLMPRRRQPNHERGPL